MAFPWMKNSFPMAIANNTEVTASALEDLRKFMWLLSHPGAGELDPFHGWIYNPAVGYELVDITLTAANWPLPTTIEPIHAGEAAVKGIPFTDGTITDLFSWIGTPTLLQNIPMPLTNGQLTPGWAYAPNPNRYMDWAKNARRYETKYFERLDSSMIEQTHRYVSIQADDKYQNDNVKYTDTGRVIPQRIPVEISKNHITDPAYLGPIYNLMCEGPPAYAVSKWITYKGEEYNLGLAGFQYAIGGGDPKGSDSPYADYKCSEAIQNQIERIVSVGGFVWPVTPGTPWGDAYIENWWKRQTISGVENIADIHEWNSTTEYLYYQNLESGYQDPRNYVKCALGELMGFFGVNKNRTWGDYRSNINVGINPWKDQASGAGFWNFLKQCPLFASLDDELWGCNESAFELLLWIYGKYDWWIDTATPHCPSSLLKYMPPFGSIERPVATWRRTWHRSMGAPRDNVNLIWPIEKGEPQGDVPSYANWCGKFLRNVPLIPLSEDEAACVNARHGKIPGSIPPAYELHVDIFNDAFGIMSLCRYIDSGITSIQCEHKFGQHTVPNTGDDQYMEFASASSAYELAKSRNLSGFDSSCYGQSDWYAFSSGGYHPLWSSGGQVTDYGEAHFGFPKYLGEEEDPQAIFRHAWHQASHVREDLRAKFVSANPAGYYFSLSLCLLGGASCNNQWYDYIAKYYYSIAAFWGGEKSITVGAEQHPVSTSVKTDSGLGFGAAPFLHDTDWEDTGGISPQNNNARAQIGIVKLDNGGLTRTYSGWEYKMNIIRTSPDAVMTGTPRFNTETGMETEDYWGVGLTWGSVLIDSLNLMFGIQSKAPFTADWTKDDSTGIFSALQWRHFAIVAKDDNKFNDKGYLIKDSNNG